MTTYPTAPPGYPPGVRPFAAGEQIDYHGPAVTYPPQDAPRSADVLAARGRPIRLLDGTEVRLRYSMASLRELERRFGSLKGISTEINAAKAAMESDELGASGPLFSILSDALRAGLLHVKRDDVDDDDRPIRYRLGADRDRADELLDPAQLQPYMEAFAGALQEAFGELAGEAGRTALEAAQGLSSPGASGTTSAPSSADGPIASSGG